MVVRAVKSGLASLTGVTKSGFPIVYFSSIKNSKIYLDVNAVSSILQYYSDVALEIYGCCNLVLIIDFNEYSDVIKKFIFESLCDCKKLIETVYVLHHLIPVEKSKTLSLLRKKKKKNVSKCDCFFHSHIPSFSFILTYSFDDLQYVASIDQLGFNSSNEFIFKLGPWIHVRKIIETLQDMCDKTHQQCLNYLKKIKEINLFDSEMRFESSEDLVEKLGSRRMFLVAKVLCICHETINLFVCPYADPVLSEMENHLVFKYARRSAMNHLQKLTEINREMKSTIRRVSQVYNKSKESSVDLSSSSSLFSLKSPTPEELASSLSKIFQYYHKKIVLRHKMTNIDDNEVSDHIVLVSNNLHQITDLHSRNSARLLLYRCMSTLAIDSTSSSNNPSC